MSGFSKRIRYLAAEKAAELNQIEPFGENPFVLEWNTFSFLQLLWLTHIIDVNIVAYVSNHYEVKTRGFFSHLTESENARSAARSETTKRNRRL